jgi:hypothetical protein
MQAVPDAEVDRGALDTAVAREEGNAEITLPTYRLPASAVNMKSCSNGTASRGEPFPGKQKSGAA